MRFVNQESIYDVCCLPFGFAAHLNLFHNGAATSSWPRKPMPFIVIQATQAYASFQLSGDLDGMAECVRIAALRQKWESFAAKV